MSKRTEFLRRTVIPNLTTALPGCLGPPILGTHRSLIFKVLRWPAEEDWARWQSEMALHAIATGKPRGFGMNCLRTIRLMMEEAQRQISAHGDHEDEVIAIPEDDYIATLFWVQKLADAGRIPTVDDYHARLVETVPGYATGVQIHKPDGTVRFVDDREDD